MKKECKHLYGSEGRKFKFCPLCGEQLLQDAKFEKGDTVYVFDSRYPHTIEQAEIFEIDYNFDPPSYVLFTTAGRRIGGWLNDGDLFATKEELVQYYLDYFEKQK